MEKLKSDFGQEIGTLILLILKSTKLLKDLYRKLRRLVIIHLIITILYCTVSVYWANTIKSVSLYTSFFVGQFLIQIPLIIYYKYQKKTANNYIKIYRGGYKAWCSLSDKIDWGIWRKKFFYKENYGISIIMNTFYTEFERPFSPVRTYNNYYKNITFILVLARCIVLIYIVWSMFIFIGI